MYGFMDGSKKGYHSRQSSRASSPSRGSSPGAVARIALPLLGVSSDGGVAGDLALLKESSLLLAPVRHH